MKQLSLGWLPLLAVQAGLAAEPDTIVFCLTERDALGNRGKALYRIDVDGTGAKRILPANPLGKRIREPNVGPVGREIALFVYPKVYTCHLDGSDLKPVINLPREHWEPRWSPDGARIVFTTDRHENADVYIMNADGSGQRNLTLSPLSNDMNPAWGPKGERVVFASDRRGNFDIFTMDDGGLGLKALTTSLADDRLPVWSPTGGKSPWRRICARAPRRSRLARPRCCDTWPRACPRKRSPRSCTSASRPSRATPRG